MRTKDAANLRVLIEYARVIAKDKQDGRETRWYVYNIEQGLSPQWLDTFREIRRRNRR